MFTKAVTLIGATLRATGVTVAALAMLSGTTGRARR